MRCRFRKQPAGRSRIAGSYDNDDPEGRDGLHMGANGADAPSMIIYTAVPSEVMTGDLAGVQTVVETHLVRTPAEVRRAFQLLIFHIQGYDEDARELYHIPDCRAWCQSIDRTYPTVEDLIAEGGQSGGADHDSGHPPGECLGVAPTGREICVTETNILRFH